MKRLLLVAVLGVLGACNKPSEESCRKAIGNMRTLLGTDSNLSQTDTEGDVRRCVGGSNKKTVECAVNAKTLDELYDCKFIKRPGAGSAAPGSAAPSAGAASGSAAP